MSPNNKYYWKDLSVIAVIKLTIHCVINGLSEFGLHRDEYLYLAESDHLAWGFMEVPPLTPFLGWITKGVFGTSDMAIRLFPALAGVASIYLIGGLVKELGGKRIAQGVGAAAFLLSPVFLGTNNLFQPVSFNQMWWLVIALLTVMIVNHSNRPHYWYILGIVTGLAILTKYSVAFFVVALVGGILISQHRKLLLNKHIIYSIAIAFIVSLPNIIWQVRHDFPVVRHMTVLASTQLVNMSIQDFIIPQFLFHFACTLVWVSGLLFVFVDKSMARSRYLGIAFFLVFILVMTLDGKPYYIFGAYSVLFALGGVAWEKWMGKKSLIPLAIILGLNMVIYPYSLPFLSPEGFISYAGKMNENYGIDAPLKWEDGSTRDIRQDYADMLGWEEIPAKVAKFYHSLPEEEKVKTMIQGGNYGHAGVLNLRRKKYDLPEAISFNSGFIAWVPDTIDFDRQIFVDNRKQGSSEYFENIILIDSISDPNARDPGYIYYRTGPKVDVQQAWKEIVREIKAQQGIK